MRFFPLLSALTALCLPATVSGQILFEDDFEGGTSAANYNWVFDADSPSGTGGVGTDLLDAAYSFTDLGTLEDLRSGTGAQLITENAATAFVNGLYVDTTAQPISIKFDLYADPNSSGSTEYAFVGVGSGTLPFQHYLSSCCVGIEETDGVFAGGLTDSDTALDGDYTIHESDGSVGSPTDLFNADAAGNNQFGTSFADILPGGTTGPSGEGTTQRVLQHQWVEVEMLMYPSFVEYRLDGARVAAVTPAVAPAGMVGFGIGDPFPSSNQGMRTIPTADTRILIDNVVVTAVPEPAAFGLLAVAGLFVSRRRR